METCPIHQKVLVCPTCLAIERGSRGGTRRGETYAKKAKKPKKSEQICTARDVLQVFRDYPDQSFNSEGVRLKLSEAKREVTSRSEIYRRLTYLHKTKFITRLNDGFYTFTAPVSAM